jgi:hypothetical protein
MGGWSGGGAELDDGSLGVEGREVKPEQGRQAAARLGQGRAFQPEDVIALCDRRGLATSLAQWALFDGVFDALDDLLIGIHRDGSLP